MRIVLVLVILLWATNPSNGQKAVTIPNPTLPSVQGPSNPLLNPFGSSLGTDNRNMRIIDQDMRNYDEQQAKERQLLKEAYRELGVDESSGTSSGLAISYALPLNKDFGKKHFENAFREINDMVEGRKPYSLKRSVFLSEFAYDTTLNYQQFEKQIAKIVEVMMLDMKQSEISPNDDLGKIMTVFKFMSDTMSVKHPALERTITTYPKTYDFEDFYGMQDYRKMFVSKLIRTGRGQCRSLPLLFLVLCEELNAKAFLSYAPEHSYIKFRDKNGNFQNIELTNQVFTTDQFILQSGYINSAAIKSRAYMDTVGIRRVVLHSLNNLANAYVKKYRYDDFVLKCAKTVVSRDPKNLHANMHLANYHNMLGRNIEKQYSMRGMTFNQVIHRDEKFREVVTNAVKYGKLLDELGYAEMPAEMYRAWLNSLKNESMKQQHLDRKRILSTMIER